MEQRDRPHFDPEPVEIVAGNILGAAVIFLLFQILILVVVLVAVVLLPGLGIMPQSTGERLGLACSVVAEAILIAALVRMVRRNVAEPASALPAPGQPVENADHLPFERQLERLMVAGAVLGLAACLLMGLGTPGARVFLAVIEAFAGVFLIIVIATRWFLTRKVGMLALAALCLTGYSLWFALRHLTG